METPILRISKGGVQRISSAAAALEEQTRILHHLLTGQATFQAIFDATQALSRNAPDDCDVLVIAGDIAVRKVQFIEPHTFKFEGFGQDGHRTWIVQHFSQVSVHVVYRPKQGPSRVITGFSPHEPSA
jgi:hypothetical protein